MLDLRHPEASTGWDSRLRLRYALRQGRTSAWHLHEGALRVLAALYPEGDAVCHHVLVHPPAGMAGGDRVRVDLELQAGAHALLTTPGATRFYRSLGASASQALHARVAEGARLEWLPLESLAYEDCIAENRAVFELEPGAEMMAWDMLALGRPAAGDAFARGSFTQHLEIPGLWLERGRIDGGDLVLREAPGGLDGQAALGTLLLAAGTPLDAARREALLETARALVAVLPEGLRAGVTSPQPGVLVLRALAGRIEPVARLLRSAWAAWRSQAWGLAACAPRVWST
jgi:urease accessory protein